MTESSPLRVLIVDDNLGQRRTTALILERKGYRVATAADGPQALELAGETAFDVVLMDVKMPSMNGVETFKRLKEISPQTIVIMMTAYAVEDLVEEALAEGAYGVLYKPLDIDELLGILAGAREAGDDALILIVDDDPGTCTTLRAILGHQGYEVGVAHSGEQAIATERETAHDLVLLDVKLPTLDGAETYLALREINPRIVAIIMTGHCEEVAGAIQQALDNSAYAYLHKPLQMDKLLELIREALAQRQAGGMPRYG